MSLILKTSHEYRMHWHSKKFEDHSPSQKDHFTRHFNLLQEFKKRTEHLDWLFTHLKF
jgi:transposase